MRRGAEQRKVSRWRDKKRKKKDGKERVLMEGGFIRTEADEERKERRKICVGGGGEGLIWRGKREATATNDGWVGARPTFL
jgi:hypothetical protein